MPLLIIVTGRPGSGKTSLAHALAKAIRCPALCRDEIKEGMVNTLGHIGEPGGAVDLAVYHLFFDTLRLLLENGVTAIAEAAFQHHRWAPKLEPLQKIARLRLVVCETDPEVARTREIERGLADPGRERFHHDPATRAARRGERLAVTNYDPPRMEAPTLVVDTSEGYCPNVEGIVHFLTQ